MKAMVSYLSRLAREAPGQPMLQPPRQVFTGDVDVPARSMGDLGSHQGRVVNAAGSSPPVGLLPVVRGAGLPAPEAAAQPSAVPTWPEPATETRATPHSPGTPRPPRAPPHWPGAGHLEVPRAAVTGPADPDGTRPGASPTSLPSRSPRPAADAGHASPPGSRPNSPRERPADLSGTVEPAPVVAQAGRPAAYTGPHAASAGPSPATAGPSPASAAPHAAPRPAPPADPARPRASAPGPIAPVGSAHDQYAHGSDAAMARRIAVGPGTLGSQGADDRHRPVEPAAVRNLMPQPSVEPPGTVPGQPLVPRRPRVSIGTIEVTIVPPVPPTPAVREIQPPAPVANGWSRPPSPFGASAGGDRLRHGFRRWYGTAQG
jgi:hypothetical protein